MRERILLVMVGLLLGIVVMQWTMPEGRADVVGAPVGNVVSIESNCVLTTDGSFWHLTTTGPETVGWERISELPMPVADVRFFGCTRIVDKNGDVWEERNPGDWVNYGQPPTSPVAAEPSTWGKIKAKFGGK